MLNITTEQITYYDNGKSAKKDSTKMVEEGECISYYENGEKELVSFQEW